jgi:hypothetical protein
MKKINLFFVYIYRSECYCGNHLLMKTKKGEENMNVSNCCSWTCSGQLNETCGGNLCNSVYALNGTIRKNLSEYF